MSIIQAARVEKPRYFGINPLKRGRGHRRVVVIGMDSEATPDGQPKLLQMNAGGGPDDTTVYRLSNQHPQPLLAALIEYLDTQATRKDTEYIVVGWNLQYEFTQAFRNLPLAEDGAAPNTQPKFEVWTGRKDASGNVISRWHITCLADKLFTATFVHLGTKRRVRWIDGYKFYTTSLDKAAGMLGLGSKVKLPDGMISHLTDDIIDSPEFREYAKQDAYLTRMVGEAIIALHEDYDIPTCVSAPQFASKVYRHHFLDAPIPLPSPDLEQAGLSSYHGGKNGYYLNGPRHFSGIWSYDITSAYPEAMRAIPNPVTAQWYPVDHWEPGRHALYQVTMEYTACTYKGAQDHAGSKISTGYVDGVWITSYELDAIMAHGEARLIHVTGYDMVGEAGGSLVEYVDRFFELKRQSKGPKREAAKLFLNSLYGKFFQKVPLGTTGYYMFEDSDSKPYIVGNDGQYDYQAGGLYHPPIASLITGFVRGKIHGLEHKYRSIMTSTDGFFATKPPDPTDLGADLGMLTATRGNVSIWRERLYDFSDGEGHDKAALHGFRGRIADLRAIPLAPGTFEYVAQQLVTLRLAGRTFTGADGAPTTPGVGTIPTLRYTLDIRGSPV